MFKRKSKSGKPAKPKKDNKKREKKPKKAKAKSPAVALKKQPSDIYTVMLIISFVAVTIACVLLIVELNQYSPYPWWKAS